MPEGTPVTLVGMQGGEVFGAAAVRSVARADVIVGSIRHLARLPDGLSSRRVPITGPLEEMLAEVDAWATAGQCVVVLTSGDPGFFGLVRLAADRLGSKRLLVYPAPSAVSLAFARLGQHWDDARVVSAHGRPLDQAVEAIVATGAGGTKIAVLVSPDQPPEALGRALVERGFGPRRVVVCSQLGHADEGLIETDLPGLAEGCWDPLSVVVLMAPATGAADRGGPGTASAATSAAVAPTWGRADHTYRHRAGMITKAEVRAVVLAKLALPRTGVFWDVGAGSGSVSADVSALAPGLTVYAVERRPDDLARIRANTSDAVAAPTVRWPGGAGGGAGGAAGGGVTVVEGEAPGVLAGLPDPDRVFVGGGGSVVLAEVLTRLRPGGVVVATYAAIERAVEGGRRLGNLVQVSISRGTPIGPGGELRLEAENPVFVCWGPHV